MSNFSKNILQQYEGQSPNPSRYDGGRMNPSQPHWNSPPWRSYPSPNNSYGCTGSPSRHSWRGNGTQHYNNFSHNSSYNAWKHPNQTSTPNRQTSTSGSNSSSSSSPSFIPLPFSPHQGRFRSPYSRGNKYHRQSYDRSFHSPNHHQQQPVESYFKASMLENPWDDGDEALDDKSISLSSETEAVSKMEVTDDTKPSG